MLKRQSALIEQLARTEPPRVERRLATKPAQAMALVAGGVDIYLPLAGLLDLEKELARLDKEIADRQQAITRARARLDNADFVSRAKPEVVQKERDALAAAKSALARLETQRREIAGL